MAAYGIAAEALLSGRLDAVSWFPEGSYLSAMIFAGDPAPLYEEIREITGYPSRV